jgi:hypothetical protein
MRTREHPLTAPALAARPTHRPKEIKEIRDFLQTARRKDARSVKVMTQKDKKVRCALRRRPVTCARDQASSGSAWRKRAAECGAAVSTCLLAPGCAGGRSHLLVCRAAPGCVPSCVLHDARAGRRCVEPRARRSLAHALCARVPLALALAQDKNRAITKFKIRCSKYLYTLVIKDEVRTLRARASPRRVWSRFRVFRRETAIKRGSSTARPSRLLLLTSSFCAASPLSLASLALAAAAGQGKEVDAVASAGPAAL